MLRLCTILFTFCTSLFSAAPLLAAPLDFKALDALVQTYDRADEPGISIAISIDGEPIYRRWAGQSDLALRNPINENTRFHIASISKQFTAFAIMLLVNEGKLSLDQDVRDIIPELEERTIPITIKHLLNHTSGLREVNSLLLLTGRSQASPVTAHQALDLIYRQRGSNFPAGDRQEYSNTGYQLLAEIVARISEQPFPEFMKKRIFLPLDMTQTFIRSDPNKIIDDIAVGYNPITDGFAHAHLLSATYGSSGIISTPRDLLRWGHALNTNKIGGPIVVGSMAARSKLKNGRRAIATNGQEYRTFLGLDTWSHGGSVGGFKSFLLRIPEKEMVITVMGNRADFLKAAFAFKVAELLLADRSEPLKQVAFIPEAGEQLDRYVGDYRLFAGVVFSLRRNEDTLTFSNFGTNDTSPLTQIGKGVFMLNPARELQLEFHDFSKGRANEMRWQVSKDGYIPALRADMHPVPVQYIKINEIEGDYYCRSLQQIITLYDRKGKLRIRSSDGKHAQLVLYQPDIFRPEGQFAIQGIKIMRGEMGSIHGLQISSSFADDLGCRKLTLPD